MNEVTRALEALRNVASRSKAANDLFHDFATRERTRGQLTVRGVSLRMKREGFEYSREEYADVLKALAECGFGKLKTNSKGRVIALVDVNTKLQSIGQAVVGKKGAVQSYAPRNKFSPLPKVIKPSPDKEIVTVLVSSASDLVKAIIESQEVSAERKVNALMALLGPGDVHGEKSR